jgi:hypothetical protein
MPRVYIDMDLDQVERAASIGCSYEEIAVIVGMARSTFYQRLADNPDIKDLIDQGKARGKSTLRRLQWQRAQGGSDTMLIWLGKNVLGQTDRTEISGNKEAPLAHSYSWADPPPPLPPKPDHERD